MHSDHPQSYTSVKLCYPHAQGDLFDTLLGEDTISQSCLSSYYPLEMLVHHEQPQ